MQLFPLAFLAVAVAAAFEFPLPTFHEENHVLVLTDADFDDAILTHDTLLVNFCSKTSPFCGMVQPEFRDAAKRLVDIDPALRLATVDAGTNPKTPALYNLDKFPVFKLFRGHNDPRTVRDYSGDLSAHGIAEWMQEHSKPLVKVVTTVEEVEALRDKFSVVLLAHLDEIDGEMHQELELVAEHDRVSVVCATTDGSLHPGIDQVGGAVLFKAFDERLAIFDGVFTFDALSAFLRRHKFPMLSVLTAENGPSLMAPSNPSRLLLVTHLDEPTYPSIADAVTAAAFHSRQEIVHVVVPISESSRHILDHFGLDEDEDVPALVLMNAPKSQSFRFPLYGNNLIHNHKMVEPLLVEFEAKYLRGDLVPDAPPPEKLRPNLYTHVNAGAYEMGVLERDDVDALVFFFTPSCEICPALRAVFHQVAVAFMTVPTIHFGEVDGSVNKVAQPRRGKPLYPAIYFYPAKDRAHIVEYVGVVTVEAISDYLKVHARKFSLDGQIYGKRYDAI
ncbi:hypothetical protein AeNC1_005086 [Aphanomyces euteiches]|nr:hypothetical protein AeNC1_005086 [Aphanomyces euteiches]